MYKRDDSEYIADIHEAINRTERYVRRMSYQRFLKDTKTQDAVVRNFQIIGEAVKKISADFKRTHREIDWRNIAGMRDRFVHQ